MSGGILSEFVMLLHSYPFAATFLPVFVEWLVEPCTSAAEWMGCL